ncbi:hypothetical protein Fcan01_16677 [Folsomia candida]|uniref:Uncharacterized protein n=1 Tax=Folsomia candida TaxID=158441 RepID=A0A226DW73_FOLCA|nr:hypothetical protein Fcan01_16677 [Folsomia candida]
MGENGRNFKPHTMEGIMTSGVNLDQCVKRRLIPFICLVFSIKKSGYISFQTGMLTGPESLKVKVMVIFIHVMEASQTSVAFGVFFFLTLLPCSPPFILSMFSNCEALRGYKLTGAVHIFEAWIMFHSLYSCSALVISTFFMGTFCFLMYLKEIDSKISTFHHLQEWIRIYHSFQVLEKSFNAVLQNRLVPTILLGVPIAQVLGLYSSIHLHGMIEMPQFLLFPMIFVNSGLINILIVTMASRVNVNSARLLTSVKRWRLKITKVERAFIKRKLGACRPLKIKLGSNNFIDRRTPLTIQNFCLTQTMSLTLMTASYSVV